MGRISYWPPCHNFCKYEVGWLWPYSRCYVPFAIDAVSDHQKAFVDYVSSERKVSEEYIKKGSLSVSTDLEKFLATEVLPGLDLSEDDFWMSLENIVDEFSPRNKKLLEIRESIQREIDAWHLANQNQEQNLSVYKDFLKDIGYLVDEGENFHISTQNVDPEITSSL